MSFDLYQYLKFKSIKDQARSSFIKISLIKHGSQISLQEKFPNNELELSENGSRGVSKKLINF